MRLILAALLTFLVGITAILPAAEPAPTAPPARSGGPDQPPAGAAAPLQYRGSPAEVRDAAS